jgi:hypothetical protein
MASKSDLPSSVPDRTSGGGSTGPEETDAEGARESPRESPRQIPSELPSEIPNGNLSEGPGEQSDWQPPFDLAPVEMDVSIVPVQPDDPDRRRRKREIREKQEQAEKYLRAIGHVRPPHASAFELPWQDLLLDCLLKMNPGAFERLCQRILSESGFIKVDVTGRSGDGGIDGIGVLRLNLLSFHVFFQCKRWKGSVGASAIRDFRGAMVGRADKGLVMTTGTFTADARKEATRDGAPAIDLVDGEDLCDLLKRLRIGVSTQKVEHVFIEQQAFLEF